MRLRAAADWMRLAAALLLAVATASFGIAHAPRPQPATPDLLLLALPDGTVPELCGAAHGDPQDPTPDRHQACLAACLVALAAAPLPSAPAMSAPVATAWRHPLLPGAGDGPRSFWAAAQARAPPPLG
jgi:hypothetical protein